MFIYQPDHQTNSAPAERDVSAMSLRDTFRSSGAREIFWSLRSIDISSLRDEEAPEPRHESNLLPSSSEPTAPATAEEII